MLQEWRSSLLIFLYAGEERGGLARQRERDYWQGRLQTNTQT